ncbi:MAG: hypothetical protein BGO07_02350 [Alphaproteobacteria bacterium 40-19]|nr:MAG: hypothetical protein BGO07_02350 [Alphaproteobacteria bacterium 40-19]
MSFKFLTFFLLPFLPMNVDGNFLKIPAGVFSLFYHGKKDGQEFFFNSEVLETKESDTKEDIFPNLWAQVVDKLQTESIVLEYEDFFKSCTKVLVEFSLNSEQTEKETLTLHEMSALFKYNPNEDSKSFSIEQPDITGNRAWLKFYTYCDEEDDH